MNSATRIKQMRDHHIPAIEANCANSNTVEGIRGLLRAYAAMREACKRLYADNDALRVALNEKRGEG